MEFGKMNKVIITLFLLLTFNSCQKDAIDLDIDKNRYISEFVRDTVYITDSVYVIKTVVRIDTVIQTIKDTIYLNRDKKLSQVYLDGAIQFSEKYWDSKKGDYVVVNHVYSEKDINYTMKANFDNLQKTLYADFVFTRGDYVNEKRGEWVFKIEVSSKYLNMENSNYLHPFGQNMELYHYFNVITTNKSYQYFSKLSQNNFMKIDFTNNFNVNKSIMIVDGFVLKNDFSNPIVFKDFLYYTLEIPLRIEDN